MDTLYYLLDKDKVEILISALDDIKSNSKLENIELSRRIIIDRLQIPIEDNVINDLVINEYFIKLFLLFFYRQYELVKPHIQDVYSREGTIVAIRRFDNLRSGYFGYPLISGDAIYDIWKGEPVLITILNDDWFNDILSSEVGWLHRPEIKILSSLTFSLPAPHGPINGLIPLRDVSHVPYNFIFGAYQIDNPLALQRARHAIMLIDQIHHLSDHDQRYQKNQGRFIFEVENQDITKVHKILDNFDIMDDLLLRTAFLMLKSVILLRTNLCFVEDSAANLYYAIEGCLRLIHRKMNKGEFNIKEVIDFLEKNFIEDYAVGEILDESYKKRLQIVHPENISTINWIPEIQTDEFFEQMGFGYCLLYYAITGEFLPPHYTYH